MKKWHLWAVLGSSMVVCGMAWGQASSAMVLSVQGEVLLEVANKTQPVEPLIRLLEGDRLRLAPGAQVRLLYARSGLQEDWQETGVLRIEGSESSIVRGKPQRQTRQLPLLITQQMARTPRTDSTARIGGVRLRNLPELTATAPKPPAPEKIAALEENYQSLRHSSPSDDRSPEVYWLAGLWDLKAHERLRTELERLKGLYPQDPVMVQLQTLYAGVLPATGAPAPGDAAK